MLEVTSTAHASFLARRRGLAGLLVAASLAWAPATSARADTPAPATSEVAAPRRALERAIAALDMRARARNGHAGVCVVDLRSGEVLASNDADVPLNPASNTKLATAAAALRILGPNRRLATELRGALQGDRVDALGLWGEGDPSLSSADLADMARTLHSRGVRHVGALLVDQTAFDDQYEPPAFDQQPDEWAPFRAPVSAVAIDENTLRFAVRASRAGQPVVVTVRPEGAVSLTNHARTSGPGRRSTLRLELTAAPGGADARLEGELPVGGKVELARRAEDPRRLAGLALRSALRAQGIAVDGDVQLGRAPEGVLVQHASAPMATLVRRLGKQSDNFYAETLLKVLGGDARPATFEAGLEKVRASLEALGAAPPGTVLRNGSGLFDANRLTAAGLVGLLRAVRREPYAQAFVDQLSVAGVDGTLRGRLRGWAKSRAIRAKTGTLRRAHSLSGYVLDAAGEPALAFSILVDGVEDGPADTRAAMDAVVEAAAAEVRPRRSTRSNP